MVDCIQISFDAATAETFARIRVEATFEQVVQNIKTLIEVKRKSGGKHLQINMVFVVNKDNVEELTSFIELAHTIGSEIGVVVQPVSDWGKNLGDASSLIPNRSIVNILNEARRKAQACGMKVSWLLPPITHNHTKDELRICYWGFTNCYITADGFVTPCCLIGDPRLINFGNLFKQDFGSIWNSEEYQNFRRQAASKNKPAVCKTCSFSFPLPTSSLLYSIYIPLLKMHLKGKQLARNKS